MQISDFPANAEPILHLNGISKFFGPLRALNEVDFTIRPGEIQALVGDNGAGKSSLIKVISGAHQADRGEIFFKGQRVAIDSPEDAIRLGIATVYQASSPLGYALSPVQ